MVDDFNEYLRKQQQVQDKATQQYQQPTQQQPQFQQPQYRQPQQPPHQYAQQPYPRPPQPAPKGSHSKFLLLLLIFLGLIGIVASLLFLFGGDETSTVPTDEFQITGTVTLEEAGLTPQDIDPQLPLSISPIRFASNVGDDLSFDEVTDATFAKGEQPWIVFDVQNLKSGSSASGVQTSYDEYIVVIGPDGSTVEDLTGFLGTETDPAEADTKYDFPIAHQLLIDASYQAGEYEVTIFIDDLVNGEETSQIGVFEVR